MLSAAVIGAAAVVVVAVVIATGMLSDSGSSVVPAMEGPNSSTVDGEPTAGPTTIVAASTSAAPSTEVGQTSDPEVLAALSGRWVLESVSDASWVARVGRVPWIEFDDDPFVRGSDGCNLFGADGSVDARGNVTLAELGSTLVDCGDEVQVSGFFAATRVVVIDGGDEIDLFEPPTTSARSWRFRRLDPLDVVASADLVGRWSIAEAGQYVEFRPDGTVWVGDCWADWALDGSQLQTTVSAASSTCLDRVDAADSAHAAMFDLLASGDATVMLETIDPTTGGPAGLLLSMRDTVVRLGFAGRVTGEVLEVSPSVDLPSLEVADTFAVPLRFRESTAERWWGPRLDLDDDGSLVVLDMVESTVTAYEVDGSIRWATSVPADIEGAHPWDVAVGPGGILYLSYERSSADATAYVLVAVATSGPRAGQAVASWPTNWQCVESFCGEVLLGRDGVLLDDFGNRDAAPVQPYVDANGQPSGARHEVPAIATQVLGPGLAMPDGAIGMDELGNQIGSFRTTVTLGDRTWTFDAVGVGIAEGTFAFFDAQSDGSVVSVFGVTNVAGEVGTTVWLDLMPDGSLQAWQLPDDVGVVLATARIGGERYAAVVSPDGTKYRLVHLTPA